MNINVPFNLTTLCKVYLISLPREKGRSDLMGKEEQNSKKHLWQKLLNFVKMLKCCKIPFNLKYNYNNHNKATVIICMQRNVLALHPLPLGKLGYAWPCPSSKINLNFLFFDCLYVWQNSQRSLNYFRR